MVGRTPWSAADAPVGLFAPCRTPTRLFRLRDGGVRPQRGPQDQGVRPTYWPATADFPASRWSQFRMALKARK
jgi:hypothetical protein